MRYAQERSGQRLHLVREVDPDFNDGFRVEDRALCGRCAPQGWRMTINVPLAMGCKNCRRVWQAIARRPSGASSR